MEKGFSFAESELIILKRSMIISGMEYGDFILRETAACISVCLSEKQRAYKLMGDEFLILDVTTDDTKEADKLFTKIKDSIDEFIEENDFEVLFTISGGSLSLHSSENIEHSKVMKLTDFALKKPKSEEETGVILLLKKTMRYFLERERLRRN